jgi:hypothetical protein
MTGRVEGKVASGASRHVTAHELAPDAGVTEY